MTYQIVPESAPFNTEQRAWLNGFLAGVLGVLDQPSAQGGSAIALAAAASQLPPPLGAGLLSAPENEESFPWHDPALSLEDRMKLAEGMSKERRLMAAMAQLNCGSCGYLCRTYSEAIANGNEKNLTLCSPGGSETAKALRALVKEPATQNSIGANPTAKSLEQTLAAPGSRENPVQAKMIASEKLNGPGSAKDTQHVAIDLEGTDLHYRVGDALGLWPTNCELLVARVLEAAKLDTSSAHPLSGKCLRTITQNFIEVAIASVRSRPTHRGLDADLLARLEAFGDSDDVYEWDVLEFLEAFSPIPWIAQEFIHALNDQRPRLYSIASSQSLFPNQVHLTVGKVVSTVRNRDRKQLEAWKKNGLLTRLDLAFSRDDAEKIYVQHRMLEHGAELFAWLEAGGYFFVCGDASKMAVDVDKALQQVIVLHGKRSAADAKHYLVTMVNAKRYVRDVY